MDNGTDGRTSPRKGNSSTDSKVLKKKSKKKKSKKSRAEEGEEADMFLAGNMLSGKLLSAPQLSRTSSTPVMKSAPKRAAWSKKNGLKSSSKDSFSSKSTDSTALAAPAPTTLAPPSKNAPGSETLRWEFAVSDEEEEAKRIEKYKVNRRKRYLAAANVDYSSWVKGEN